MYSSFVQQQRAQFNGHIPYRYTTFGRINVHPTNVDKYGFLQVYRSRLSTEWSPSYARTLQPPMVIQTRPIYHSSIGMLPNYTGHVPGSKLRFGRSFGADTMDAKRWIHNEGAA